MERRSPSERSLALIVSVGFIVSLIGGALARARQSYDDSSVCLSTVQIFLFSIRGFPPTPTEMEDQGSTMMLLLLLDGNDLERSIGTDSSS